MKRLYKQNQSYAMSLRAISKDLRTIKIHTDQISYAVKQEMSFDIKNSLLTSTDHFIGGIASGLLWNIIEADNQSNRILAEIEGKFIFQLQNPLVYIHVRGYKGVPRISNAQITFYCVSFTSESAVKQLVNDALAHSLIYNTVKDCINFRWQTKVVY